MKVPESGARTLTEALEKTVEKFGSRRAAGWREVVKVHMVDGREKIELKNEYLWLTYKEYFERVQSLSRGLSSIGVRPQSKVVIYAETQRDWMVTAFATWFNNAQVVTIYATLGEEGAIHGICETEADTVVADAKLLKIVTKILPQCKSVKNVVTMAPGEQTLKDSNKNVGFYTIDELCQKGKNLHSSPPKPSPEDVCVIMYTSGTTADPKGVVIQHSNIVASNIAATNHTVQGLITEEDVYMCYLPLAHIFEMGAEMWAINKGMALGFGSPHTLTENGIKLKRPESEGDAFLLQPTFMVFPPAVLDKIYQGVQAKRAAGSGLVKFLFNKTLETGERNIKEGLIGPDPMWDKLVGKKVQKGVGGRLKCLVAGSAPLSPDVQRFVQTLMNAPVRQGYGLTETCASSAVSFWGDNAESAVGPPTTCTVIRLADWEEGNYMNSDKDKPGVGMRRGEILIGGPSVTKCYFINPKMPNAELQKKNKEDWVEIDGIRFFRTGDIGQIRPDGTLQIIDRKKDLWKGPNGEYVALSKVEAALKLCDFVEVPMCYGKTGGGFPVALVCPQQPRILALAKELGLGESYEALCSNEKLVGKVAQACIAKCKEQQLKEFEIPKKYALIPDTWTPENEMLTAAMKLKRPVIATKHKASIDKLYA